ncbi:hypothetical protein HDK77DRAFT_427185 [Phyllosticta capitalensis]|uniref:uncharacterized protein n=1 Tax=Phyllosticta capitalensis TaxID=121624 RepID=UPI00312E6665
MLFSTVLLASSAALAAAQDFNAICATPGACLRIKQFFAIEPADPKSADHTAIEFNILNDNANFGASAECEADWPYGTEDWPKQRKDCSIPDFSFYFNGFNGDIDTDFVIEATAGYRDPAVAGPPTPGRAPQDYVTNFARGNVTKDVVACETFGVSYKFCYLKEDKEILMPIYAKTA